MKTLIVLFGLAIIATAQPAAKPAPETPVSKETTLGLELVQRQANDIQDKIAAISKQLDDLKSLLLAPVQTQFNSIMADACKAAKLEPTECGYNPTTKSVHKVEATKPTTPQLPSVPPQGAK